MQLLKDKILNEARVINDTVLLVDTFINHQVDPELMQEIGKTFSAIYKMEGVTKVITIESSGIAPALMTALMLNVPLVIARKQKSITTQDNIYTEKVVSFTKQQTNDVTVAQKLLQASDRVLIIDDFLAHGEAALGLARIVEKSGAKVVGIGIVIEKVFQLGGRKLQDAGYRVDSLARIENMSSGKIIFAEKNPIYASPKL